MMEIRTSGPPKLYDHGIITFQKKGNDFYIDNVFENEKIKIEGDKIIYFDKKDYIKI